MWALYIGSAGKTSVLTYTMPFWLLLIAWPVLGERIRGTQWVAVVLALAGLLFVLDPWGLHGLAAGLLAVAGGLSWAIASVLFKIIRRRHQVEILSFTAWQGLLGSIPLIVAAFATATHGPTWNGASCAALCLQRHRGQRVRVAALAVRAAQPAGRHRRHQQPGHTGSGGAGGLDPARRAAGDPRASAWDSSWRRWPCSLREGCMSHQAQLEA